MTCEIATPTEIFYNLIANEFDKTRVRLWPCVKSFLDNFLSNSLILDIGCGNGKYMNYRNDIKIKGIDISQELVNICINKGFDVIKGNMTNLPYNDNYFDGIICIASYHHLENDNDRKKTLNEIYRVLKNNGVCFLEVWAKEQYDNNKEFKNKSNLVKWTSVKTGNIYYRFYNIYSNGELEEEIQKFEPRFIIINNGYEKGNYYVILQKNDYKSLIMN